MGKRRCLAAAGVGFGLLAGPFSVVGQAKPAPRPAAAVLAAAPGTTLAAGTAKMAMTMDMDFAVAGKSLSGSMKVDGAVDFTGSRLAMTMDMTDFMKSIASQAGPKAEKELAKLGDFSFEMRMAQRIMYMRMPKIAMQSLGSTKAWIKIDLALLGADAGVAGAVTGQSTGPNDALAYLSGASSTGLTTVGRDKVRGAESTHYAGTIDVAKVLENTAAMRKQYGRVFPDEAAIRKVFASSSIKFDAWVDDNGRMRKLVMPIKFFQQNIGGTMTYAVEYFDFGSTVAVSVPPAADTVDASTIPALWNQMKQASRSTVR
jgi:hypothetical protein